jgi:hypothetical protein
VRLRQRKVARVVQAAALLLLAGGGAHAACEGTGWTESGYLDPLGGGAIPGSDTAQAVTACNWSGQTQVKELLIQNAQFSYQKFNETLCQCESKSLSGSVSCGTTSVPSHYKAVRSPVHWNGYYTWYTKWTKGESTCPGHTMDGPYFVPSCTLDGTTTTLVWCAC